VSDYVRIRIAPDPDGSGELFIEYSTSGFSGKSSAWFDLTDLEKRVERFLDFPVSIDDLPCLSGGYWNQDGTKLESEHIFLSVRPSGHLGQLVLSIRCATSAADLECGESRCSGSAEVAITYQQLAQFSTELKNLVCARADGSVVIQLR
jgi:hypothetical protein